MHTENFTAIASAAADAPGLEQPEGEQPEIARLAEFDEALGELPPHATTPIPTTATRMASALRRRSPTPTSIHRSSTCCQSTYSGVNRERVSRSAFSQ